jgi:hypothetical protein
MTKLKLGHFALGASIAVGVAATMARAIAGTNDGDIFRSTNGESMRARDVATCTFSKPSPDGPTVLFFPSDRGNLFEVPKNGSTGGNPIFIKRAGTSDKGFYRIYKASESVYTMVHRDKPLVIMIFNNEQFDGFCDKLIPQFMSE